MIDRAVHKKSTKVEHMHFLNDGNMESPPFSGGIMNASHNSEFKQPELPKYDNTSGDCMEHLIDFKNKLMLHAQDGALLCKLFPTTLQREGFKWFTELKPKFITSWKQLQELFFERFLLNESKKKDIATNFLMQQTKGESLHKFVQMFREAASEVHIRDESAII